MNPPRIFIVDDDPDVRRGLALLLATENLAADTYASADAFWTTHASAAGALFGCLILDMRMPGMSGLELQDRLHAAGSALPIVFLTAHGDVPQAVAAMHAGAADFLLKPVDGEQLLQRIAHLLAAETVRSARCAAQAAHLARLARLSAREKEVLHLALVGHSNPAIGLALGLSHRTVEAHRSRLLLRLEASSVLDWQTACQASGLDTPQLLAHLAPATPADVPAANPLPEFPSSAPPPTAPIPPLKKGRPGGICPQSVSEDEL